MLFICSLAGKSQNDPTLSYAEQLAALEAEMDSLSIFNLIESVMALEATTTSELNLHFSFTSSVTSAGRDFDINQQGISPGISYYHKTGLYADISGYWNSNIEPNYNPTILSLGYLTTIDSKWSYSLDFERWFFNPKDSSENPLTNSFGGSLTYDIDFLNIGIDYSLLVGRETSHRFIGTIGSTIKVGKWWVFDEIKLFPTGTILFGNNDITQLIINERVFSQANAERIADIITFEDLNTRQKSLLGLIILEAFENEIITSEERRKLLSKLRNSEQLNQEDTEALQKIANGSFESTEFVAGNEFGILNYSISLPISLKMKKFNLLLSYTYSIPIALPGEFFKVDPVGFFGASLSYRIPFK